MWVLTKQQLPWVNEQSSQSLTQVWLNMFLSRGQSEGTRELGLFPDLLENTERLRVHDSEGLVCGCRRRPGYVITPWVSKFHPL